MNPHHTFDRQFARRLAVLIESGLIDYRHYYPWADAVILALDEAPLWVLKLAVTSDAKQAVLLCRGFANSNLEENFKARWQDDENWTISCLFLRYEGGTLTWLQFLQQVDFFLDERRSYHSKIQFFWFLGVFEEYGDHSLEAEQRGEVVTAYREEIEAARDFYERFLNNPR